MGSCGKTGCANEATHVPQLCVPAKDVPIDLRQPITAIMGLELCEQHVDENELRLWILNNRDFRQIIDGMIATTGKAPPDHSRGYVSKVLISSPEYQAYLKGVAARKASAA